MKDLPITVTVSIHLPPAFQEACKELDIVAGQTLQGFIQYVSFYAFMVAPTMEPSSLASTIFKSYVHERKINPMDKPEKRDIGLAYFRQIALLIQSKLSRRKKEKLYQSIMEEWYADLLKINEL